MSSEFSSEDVLENSVETMTGIAIAAHNLSKTYHLYNAPSDRLKQIVFGRNRKFYDEYAALSDISFQLPKGEVLGLVGRNGAGKSTLLQLICGTLSPTSGELTIHGRIAALLELGAGFNPEFTGRENIYLSAAVMGIGQKEIDDKLEDIIDFSGVRSFIDQPVKTYSSGMYVRLAFSVATSVEPDILVIDEALSVGDGDFARRSFERIMAMRDAGKTILFCSHSLYQIEALCTQAIWLEQGQVRASGKPEQIVPEYQSFLDQLENTGAEAAVAEPRAEDGQAETVPVDVGDEENATNLDLVPEPENTDLPHLQTSGLGSGARLTRITASADGVSGKTLLLTSRSSNLHLDIEFQTTLADETPQVALAIHSAGGQLITSCGSWVDGVSPVIDSQGNGRIQVVYENLPLLKGTYYIGVLLFCERGIFLHDEADPAVTLHVSQPNKERGIVYLPHRWLVTDSAVMQGNSPVPATHAPRWHATSADDVSQASLLALFEQVFGCALDPRVWRWKYRFADSPGSVVLENDRVVAFCGGIPRAGLVFGQPESMVQMGDIMVAKDVRGVLSKKGPFYLAAQHYLAPKVGSGLRYSLAFGFPNERACKVGIKHGLYNIVDKIIEPHWAPLPDTEHQLYISRLIDTATDSQWQQQVDALWQAMKQDINDVAIGCRDSQWIKYRYIDKPMADYQLYFVFPQLGEDNSAPAGLLVLKYHESQAMELLDIVGPRSSVQDLINAARQITAANHLPYLFAWATASVLEWFADTEPQVNSTEVVIPGCNINSPDHALRVKDRWWILGGDSDFR